MRRQSIGKRLVLTERDLEIFRLLERYRYLNSKYLQAFAGGRSAKRFKERLGDLFHEGYLDRPLRQWDFAQSRHRPLIYESGKGREQILHGQIDPPAPLTFLAATHHRQFQHSVMICHLIGAIELLSLQNGAIDLISWREILAKAPITSRQIKAPFAVPVTLTNSKDGTAFHHQTAVVPDAVFGLRYSSNGVPKYRFFALEVDRRTMPVVRSGPRGTSYERKLAAYQELLDRRLFKSVWGLPNLLVLTVSLNASHLETQMDCAAMIGEGRSAFLFKALSATTLIDPDGAMAAMASPWMTADNRQVDIVTS